MDKLAFLDCSAFVLETHRIAGVLSKQLLNKSCRDIIRDGISHNVHPFHRTDNQNKRTSPTHVWDGTAIVPGQHNKQLYDHVNSVHNHGSL